MSSGRPTRSRLLRKLIVTLWWLPAVALCLYGAQAAVVAYYHTVPLQTKTLDNVTVSLYRGVGGLDYIPAIGVLMLVAGNCTLYAEHEGTTYRIRGLDLAGDVDFEGLKVERRADRVFVRSPYRDHGSFRIGGK